MSVGALHTVVYVKYSICITCNLLFTFHVPCFDTQVPVNRFRASTKNKQSPAIIYYCVESDKSRCQSDVEEIIAN